MHIVSVNQGTVQTVPYRGNQVKTGIYKRAVSGPVQVDTLGLVDDVQVDKRYHGGVDKAVYIYPSEHYPWWCEKLGVADLEWGTFGENLTTAGLIESDLSAGDRLRVGGVVLQITDPRQPCFKLGARLHNMRALKWMAQSGYGGWYCRVLQPGILTVGDGIERL